MWALAARRGRYGLLAEENIQKSSHALDNAQLSNSRTGTSHLGRQLLLTPWCHSGAAEIIITQRHGPEKSPISCPDPHQPIMLKPAREFARPDSWLSPLVRILKPVPALPLALGPEVNHRLVHIQSSGRNRPPLSIFDFPDSVCDTPSSTFLCFSVTHSHHDFSLDSPRTCGRRALLRHGRLGQRPHHPLLGLLQDVLRVGGQGMKSVDLLVLGTS